MVNIGLFCDALDVVVIVVAKVDDVVDYLVVILEVVAVVNVVAMVNGVVVIVDIVLVMVDKI